MKKVVIIGAGPAGLLFALYLLRRGGYRIELYERRTQIDAVNRQRRRTFPFSLKPPALAAIRALPGLEAKLAERGLWANGIWVYQNGPQPRYIPTQPPMLLIERSQVVAVLLDELQPFVQANTFQIHYGASAAQISTAPQRLTIQPAVGEPFEVPYDYLVAADGVNSGVRESLGQQGQLQHGKICLGQGYRVFRVPSELGAISLSQNRAHVWLLGIGARVVAAPQPDGWVHCAFIFPLNNDPLKDCDRPREVLRYFRRRSKVLGQLLSESEAAQLMTCPISEIGSVKCDRLHVGNQILLIGDAGHALPISTGKGCSTALEDVQRFTQMLNQHNEDWAAALAAFTTQRLPEMHALLVPPEQRTKRQARKLALSALLKSYGSAQQEKSSGFLSKSSR